MSAGCSSSLPHSRSLAARHFILVHITTKDRCRIALPSLSSSPQLVSEFFSPLHTSSPPLLHILYLGSSSTSTTCLQKCLVYCKSRQDGSRGSEHNSPRRPYCVLPLESYRSSDYLFRNSHHCTLARLIQNLGLTVSADTSQPVVKREPLGHSHSLSRTPTNSDWQLVQQADTTPADEAYTYYSSPSAQAQSMPVRISPPDPRSFHPNHQASTTAPLTMRTPGSRSESFLLFSVRT